MDHAALVAAANKALDTAFENGHRRDLNEASTRTFVIEPILSALGYNTLDRLSQEVYLPGHGESVDYVLTTGERRIFVEAKALSIKLREKEAIQLVRYCSYQPVRWALLTNGVEWHIFDTDVSGDWEAKRVARVDLAAAHRDGRLEAVLRPLDLFAHDALAAGDAELSAWSRDERARACLDGLLSAPDSPVIRAAVEAIAKRGISLEPAAVVAMLRGRAAPPAAAPPAPRPAVAVPAATAPSQPTAAGVVNFFLLSSWNERGCDSLEYLRLWLPTGAWWIGPSAVDRLAPQPGDQCCFFATRRDRTDTGRGIVATAEIAGVADQEIPRDEWPGPGDWGPGRFRLPLRNVDWLREPLWPTRRIRHKLDALQPERPGQRLQGIGARSIRRLTEHDFRLLTGRA